MSWSLILSEERRTIIFLSSLLWSVNWMMTDRVWQFWTWEAWLNACLIIEWKNERQWSWWWPRSINNAWLVMITLSSSSAGSEVDRRFIVKTEIDFRWAIFPDQLLELLLRLLRSAAIVQHSSASKTSSGLRRSRYKKIITLNFRSSRCDKKICL